MPKHLKLFITHLKFLVIKAIKENRRTYNHTMHPVIIQGIVSEQHFQLKTQIYISIKLTIESPSVSIK